MDIKAYEDFLQIVDSIAEGEMSFRYEVERERGYQVVKSAINEAKELGSFGERRIALENLLDILSEVGLFLSVEQINIADRAFGSPENMNEELLIDYYKKNLVKNYKNMQDIIDMELEEYIPLKIIFNRDEEAVEYISYSKDKTSSLEFTVGIKSKLLKRITLLLCKEYSETTNKLVVENFEAGKIIFHSDDIECPVFKTILYSNGTRIILSDKKSSHYIKMDKAYFGLSETDDIIEICVCDMSVSELEHLKNELELQWVNCMSEPYKIKFNPQVKSIPNPFK